ISANATNIAATRAAVKVNPVNGGAGIFVPSVSVGKNLQNTITISISPPSPGGIQMVLSSSSPTKLLLSGRLTEGGAGQITIPIPAGSSDVSGINLQSLADNGIVTLTATAP